MGNNRDHKEMIDLLDTTLDTFGADVSRWPDDVRQSLEEFIKVDAEAQSRMAEARAFDRLLAFAPAVDGSRQKMLVDQIIDKAQRQPRMVAASKAPAAARRVHNPLQRNSWVAGALAASLVLGVLAGRLPFVNSVTDAFLGEDVQTQQVVAQGLDVDSLWDEDLL